MSSPDFYSCHAPDGTRIDNATYTAQGIERLRRAGTITDTHRVIKIGESLARPVATVFGPLPGVAAIPASSPAATGASAADDAERTPGPGQRLWRLTCRELPADILDAALSLALRIAALAIIIPGISWLVGPLTRATTASHERPRWFPPLPASLAGADADRTLLHDIGFTTILAVIAAMLIALSEILIDGVRHRDQPLQGHLVTHFGAGLVLIGTTATLACLDAPVQAAMLRTWWDQLAHGAG